jgi:hypothetical protein
MRRLFPVIFVIAAAAVGCASPPKAYIPVDSPLRTWSPPEADAAYTPEPPAAPASPAPDAKKAGK